MDNIYSVNDIKALYEFYEKRVTTAPDNQQMLINTMLTGLDDIMFRISLKVFDQYGLYVDGLCSALPTRDKKALVAASNHLIEDAEVEVSETEDKHIQTAVAVGEILTKTDTTQNPTWKNRLEETTFNLLKNKIRKGRVKDTMEVVDTYRYYYKDLIDEGSINMTELFNKIEEETGCKAFNSIRNTVTQIAITRNSAAKAKNKYPGFKEAMDFLVKSIPGFTYDDARKFVEESTVTYAPQVFEIVSKKREERNKKREIYEEKGYTKK